MGGGKTSDEVNEDIAGGIEDSTCLSLVRLTPCRSSAPRIAFVASSALRLARVASIQHQAPSTNHQAPSRKVDPAKSSQTVRACCAPGVFLHPYSSSQSRHNTQLTKLKIMPSRFILTLRSRGAIGVGGDMSMSININVDQKAVRRTRVVGAAAALCI